MSQRPNITRPKSLKAKMVGPEADLGFSWAPVNGVLLGLGIVLILVGYLALSKGSITLAPVLLVAGYVVVAPAALVLLGRGKTSGE